MSSPATRLAAYDDTPAAMTRGAGDRSRPSLGDPAKMAAAIIDAVDASPVPRRVVLGSDSYRFITAALRDRLAEIEPQEASASATDWTDWSDLSSPGTGTPACATQCRRSGKSGQVSDGIRTTAFVLSVPAVDTVGDRNAVAS